MVTKTIYVIDIDGIQNAIYTKAIGSLKLLQLQANVYRLFSCARMCTSVHLLLTYIKHFSSFHYETILFPERNTLHAYGHYTSHTYSMSLFIRCAMRCNGVAHIFYNTVAFHLMFYMYLLFVAADADAIRSLTVCSVCCRKLCAF